MKSVYIGFMRLITLNFKLWGKPTELGWRVSDKIPNGKNNITSKNT